MVCFEDRSRDVGERYRFANSFGKNFAAHVNGYILHHRFIKYEGFKYNFDGRGSIISETWTSLLGGGKYFLIMKVTSSLYANPVGTDLDFSGTNLT